MKDLDPTDVLGSGDNVFGMFGPPDVYANFGEESYFGLPDSSGLFESSKKQCKIPGCPHIAPTGSTLCMPHLKSVNVCRVNGCQETTMNGVCSLHATENNNSQNPVQMPNLQLGGTQAEYLSFDDTKKEKNLLLPDNNNNFSLPRNGVEKNSQLLNNGQRYCQIQGCTAHKDNGTDYCSYHYNIKAKQSYLNDHQAAAAYLGIDSNDPSLFGMPHRLHQQHRSQRRPNMPTQQRQFFQQRNQPTMQGCHTGQIQRHPYTQAPNTSLIGASMHQGLDSFNGSGFDPSTGMPFPNQYPYVEGYDRTYDRNVQSQLVVRCKHPLCARYPIADNLCEVHGAKICKQPGCNQAAAPVGIRDFCDEHGGGRRCREPGCSNIRRGSAGYCNEHGGQRRCQHEGCTKPASTVGVTTFCKSHGGGRRCQFPGCMKFPQGPSGKCIAHGGGKRCKSPGCKKAARGKTDFCMVHGGGKRCKKENCTKAAAAVGIKDFCVGHGGGHRCKHKGCTKSARAGPTGLCAAHGGGRKCKYEGCTKYDIGWGFCKGHGGGRRCSIENCNLPAKGSRGKCEMHLSENQPTVRVANNQLMPHMHYNNTQNVPGSRNFNTQPSKPGYPSMHSNMMRRKSVQYGNHDVTLQSSYLSGSGIDPPTQRSKLPNVVEEPQLFSGKRRKVADTTVGDVQQAPPKRIAAIEVPAEIK